MRENWLTNMSAKITVRDLVDHFGSIKIMSHVLGVTTNCVANWLRRGGVSENGALRIEKVTFGKFEESDIPRASYKKPEA